MYMSKKHKNSRIALLIGATGCGQRLIINALFETQKAKAGADADPVIQELAQMQWGDNLVSCDSPDLGDSPLDAVRFGIIAL